MSSRTLILSDLHLGRPRLAAISAEALRPLWEGCSKLIVNGDVAEVHHPLHWTTAARQTLQLHDLCEADGVELVLLSGNHDPYLTDIRHLELAGGSVFITHGDVLHPAVAPWSPRAGLIRDAHQRAIEAIPLDERDHLETRLKVSQFASHAEWAQMSVEAARSTVPQMLLRPWSALQVLWYWRQFPKLAAKFLAEHAPQARVGVFGHTHKPGWWSIDNREIINTGCYGFPGTPRAVLIEDDRRLSVLGIELDRSARRYRFMPQPARVMELPIVEDVTRRRPNVSQPLAA